MFKKLMGRIHQEERGITGLETAIILIAFVVVASVFAYTVLSVGLFATERGKEAVHAGLEGARSTIELRGGVLALRSNTTATAVNQLTLIVSSALGGEPINFVKPADTNPTDGRADDNSFNVVVISYIDQNQQRRDLAWTWTAIGADDGDNLLEAGEKFQITIGAAADAGGLVSALAPDLRAGDTFTIEINPPVGAVLTIERTIPAVLDAVMNLN